MRIRPFVRYLKPYRAACILGPLFKWIEAALELYLPLLMAQVIDRGILTGDTTYLRRQGLLMLGIVTLGLCCALICQYVASVASQGFGTGVRNALFRKIGTLSQSQIEEIGTASCANRLTNDVTQMQHAVAMLIRLVVRAPFLCVGGIVMAMTINLPLSLILLAAVPLLVLVITVVMRRTVPLYRRVQVKLDNLIRILRENLSGLRVIRAFARTRPEQKRFFEAANDHAKESIHVGKIAAVLNPMTQLILNLAIMGIVWLGRLRVPEGSVTTGELIALINYATQLLAAIIAVSNLVTVFSKAYASCGRVAEIMIMEPSVQDGTVTAGTDTAAPAVEFRHVTFSYGEGEPELQDISFSVGRGQTVGIIGGTGSGKSTLLSLVLRLYDVSDGCVAVNGVDVRDYTQSALRRKIGMVPQKAELFSGTVADNLRFGCNTATMEDLRNAAQTAKIASTIDALPNGYDSVVERSGANFSGGQKQRLAIARALVRRPEILMLDDSFSALDYATDAAVRRGLRAGFRDATVLVVSQRVSTVRNSDQILVLEDGHLAGCGTHENLLRSCEAYRDICRSQDEEVDT